MSALTDTRTPAAASPDTARSPHVTFPHLVRSEWIKFWTVRSTLWIVPISVLLMVGLGFLIAFAATHVPGAGAGGGGGGGERRGNEVFDASTLSNFMVGFSKLTIAVLAVLTITGEYTTGMIRTTLTAAPKRLGALLAKVLIVVSVTFAVGIVGAAITWVVTRPVLGDKYAIDLASSETRRILLGAPLYITGIALLAFALGALMRHSAAAIATVLGLLLVIEGIWSALPWAFFQTTGPFLPGTAGLKIMSSQAAIEAGRATAHGAVLSAWQGYGVLIAWGVVLLAVAAVLLRRRDA
jgi:ABC-2 type transport system permease protein